jgi:leader peptidase (prepilin peptidase)/N-methyltransferase
MVTAALFGVMAARWGRHLETLAYIILVAALVALSAIDLRTRRLPRRLIYLAAASSAPLLVVAAIQRHQPHRVANAAIGAGIGLGFFLLLFVVWPGGMGDGDVRLAGLLGMHLGWIGLLHVPVGLFLGFLAGAVAGVVALGRGKDRKATLPFGPFMALGALVAIVWGRSLIRVWLGG